MLVISVGCAGGQEVTPEALAQAKRLWTQANIRDYDLDWNVRGRNNAQYTITVRDGEVRRIEAIQRDGSKVELRSGDARAFGVDGIFRTINDELALIKSDHPFDQPKGTRVAMRFLPDEKLGYPHWYHRDVMGTPLSIAIEVTGLKPVPASTTTP